MSDVGSEDVHDSDLDSDLFSEIASVSEESEVYSSGSELDLHADSDCNSNSIRKELGNWAVKRNITHLAIGELLAIL